MTRRATVRVMLGLAALARGVLPLYAQHIAAPAEHHRMAAPRFAADAWAYVQACSGMTAAPGAWRTVTWTHGPARTYLGTNDTIYGQWFPPDTIWLAAGYEQHIHVITHELLHHLLRTQPPVNPHPYRPFVRPCGLMMWQAAWFVLPLGPVALRARGDSLGFPEAGP